MAPYRRFPLAPFLLTLCAAALQFTALAAQSLWYDEGFSVWLALQPPQAIIEITAADIQPPLYYLLLNGWIHLTGTSEYALRWFSAFFAVLCVPLGWQMARRLTRDPLTATFFALIMALSPLWLWYGREVRNYALLLALLLGGAYALAQLFATWDAPVAPSPDSSNRQTPRRLSPALTLAILLTIGLYTHYFMLFIVAAWGVVAGVYALAQPRVRLRGVLVAFGIPTLLYLPWVGIMLTRLGADRSYWEGQLNIGEALSKTVASWVAGHTLAESTAIPLGWLAVGLAVVGVALWGLQRGNQARLRSLWFVVAWAVLPVASYLAVALNRPKFNARYLIFSAPAFWLAIVVVVAWLWRKNKAAGVVVGVVVLLSQLLPTYALYTDPTFAKADWRGAAAYLQANRQPDEPVFLVSGHAYPMTEYYLPDLPIVPLPPSQTLDTSVIVGAASADALLTPLEGATGAWLLNWQDEVVDPEGVTPALLEAAGGAEEGAPLFQEVRLRHWRFDAPAALSIPYTPQNPLAVRFEDALTLQGWSTPATPPSADEGLAVQLFWVAQRPLREDYKMRLRVVDDNGFEYGVLDQRPTAYNLPTFRWLPQEVRLATLRVPLQAGTPAGAYWVDLSIYREGDGSDLNIWDSANAPQGQSTRIGRVMVAPAADGWADAAPPTTAQPINQDISENIELLGVNLEAEQAWQAGLPQPITLWWHATADLAAATLRWQCATPQAVVFDSTLSLSNAITAENLSAEPALVMTPLLFRVPTDGSDGACDLTLTVQPPNNAPAVSVELGSINYETTPYNFEPPTPAVVYPATFGDRIALLGYTQEGDNRLTLYWQATGEMTQSYTAFVHVLDANGVLIPNGGQDKVPLEGTRPTNSWVEGEYLTDTFTLTLSTDDAGSPYQIEVGWYDAADPTFPRLPATGEGADGNRILFPLPPQP